MAKNTLLSEADIDEILASVEKTLEQSKSLAKSTPLKKDDMQRPDEDESAPADAAPAPEAEAPAPEAAPEAPAEEQAPEAPTEELQEEQEEGPLSDEELAQVYGSMDQEELARHMQAIQQFMGQEQEASPEQAPEAAPEAPAEEPEAMMGKSEEVENLKKEIAELKKAQQMQIKAFEILAAPARKAVTGIEYVKKSEAEVESVELSKSEINAKLAEISPAKLSKSERDTVNGYLLNNQGKEQVIEIIRTKGGK